MCLMREFTAPVRKGERVKICTLFEVSDMQNLACENYTSPELLDYGVWILFLSTNYTVL